MTTTLSGGFDALRSTVTGAVLGPDDAGYDTARTVWNAAFDRRPAVIVRCAGPEDVAAGIGFASDRDQPGHYMTIVEFTSYDEAMRNSNDPTTGDYAARMAELLDGPPAFYNLDVRTVIEPIH